MIKTYTIPFVENNESENKDQALFTTRNYSQVSTMINYITFIRIFKFKKFLDENQQLKSPQIDFSIVQSQQKIYYHIILIPLMGSSLSVKIEFSSDLNFKISNCFLNIQLSVHSKLMNVFTYKFEDKYSLSQPFFIKNDYVKYGKELLDLKMLNPLIIRVRIYQNKTPIPCDYLLGLVNEGNTCYMNSILQNLVNIPLIYNGILAIPSKEDDKLFSFQKLIYFLKHKKSEIHSVIKFSDYIQNSLFLGNFIFKTQQDAQEIYLYLFEYLSNKEKEYCNQCLLSKVCQGIIQNDIRCEEKDYSSSIKESFFFLSLNINGCLTLYECFEKFLQVEKLTEDNSLQIENKKYEATKTLSFKCLPKILMIHLKRFSIDHKLTQKVIYSNQLNLEGYYQDHPLYLLYSVIVHEGNLNHGHYYIFIKQFKEDKWIKFNDSVVSYANEKEVLDDNYGGYIKWTEVSDEGELLDYSKDIERTAYILTYIDESFISEAFSDTKISLNFENRLYYLPKQKSILDYMHGDVSKPKTQTEEKVINQIQQNNNNIQSKDNLTSFSIEIFDRELKKTNNKKLFFDMSKSIYSSDFIKVAISIEHYHSHCKIAKVNEFNMFICFANDKKEDLRPYLEKTNTSIQLKLFIIGDTDDTSVIYVIQRYSFFKSKNQIELEHIILDDSYFKNFFYKKNASNLFEVVSSTDEIQKASKFEEIKLKPYQYIKRTQKDCKIVCLVLKTMK